MTIRYNLLTILKYLSKKEALIYLNKRIEKYPIISNKEVLAGSGSLPSYLLDNEYFVCSNKDEIKNVTEEDRLIYLYLAGKRDYLDFKMKGIDTLPTIFCDLDINRLKLNNLIEVRGNKIIFKKQVPTMVGNNKNRGIKNGSI